MLNTIHLLHTWSKILDINKQWKQFWSLETVGVKPNEEPSKTKEDSYEVKLPFKVDHHILPSNFNLCKNRLDI